MSGTAAAPIELTGQDLRIDDVVAVARGGRPAQLARAAREAMAASHAWLTERVYEDDDIVYGVNTGFGPLAGQRVDVEQMRRLSQNVIAACMAGVGPPLPADIVRAMLLIRANTLAAGLSGVRPEVAETLCAMLERDVVPIVPAKGSLGASGDLAPLAHIAAVVAELDMGHEHDSGRAWFEGRELSGREAMARAGIPRLVLEAKDGLSLTNGTTFMVAAAALAAADAAALVEQAEIAAALSYEALTALTAPLAPSLHDASRQPGQVETARRLRELLEGSGLVDSDPERVQDAYSLRCMPQVAGPVRDLLGFLSGRVADALNGVSDNPLIVPSDETDGRYRVVSGGNFHGQGPALWLDTLAIAMAELASIAERRTFRILTPELSHGLPSMLVTGSGLDSGLMMAQYTAAALVSDSKTLTHPDSVDSIPSSANQEDHVSMGANAARHCLEVLDNVRTVVAIELLLACQGIDLRPDGPARLGAGTGAAYRAIREDVSFMEHDRPVSPDIEAIVSLIEKGVIGAAVTAALSAEPAPG